VSNAQLLTWSVGIWHDSDQSPGVAGGRRRFLWTKHERPLLALSGHADRVGECPLSRAKQTLNRHLEEGSDPYKITDGTGK